MNEIVSHIVVYQPPCLTVGIGCNRGTPAGEILDAIQSTFDRAGLALESVCCLATVENKVGEEGIVEVCRERNWTLQVVSRKEIRSMGELPHASVWAQKALGVPGVAEPAAMLAAGTSSLLVVFSSSSHNMV